MSPELQEIVAALEENMGRVVLGKRDVVRLCIVALLAGEHILLEDVPGVGKTLIGKAAAANLTKAYADHVAIVEDRCLDAIAGEILSVDRDGARGGPAGEVVLEAAVDNQVGMG